MAKYTSLSPESSRPSIAPAGSRPDTVAIADVQPTIEAGRYPVKRVTGERLTVSADIFKDGHDVVAAMLRTKKRQGRGWTERRMSPGLNDRWSADVAFDELGIYRFAIEAWSDEFLTWLHDFERRLTGDQSDLGTDIEEGRLIIVASADRAKRAKSAKGADELTALAKTLAKTNAPDVPAIFESTEVLDLLFRWTDRSLSTVHDPGYRVKVERPAARFSAWYEFFPRSATGTPQHGTFRDCLPRLDDAREMGFDIVYFPPIHPIGMKFRKGKNNTLTPTADDVGSPWAIGGKDGGHDAVEPALGSAADFEWLIGEAKKRGMELAMDFAIQCSPDHPWVKEHPEWFFPRPDGTIKYAENPPKKYQDIYPINFHCEGYEKLWHALYDVVRYWVNRGVRTFRVDNPHTKPCSFWEWLIEQIHRTDPDVMFLAEAFTRPRMMEMLGKVGFTQSYTYFTWRESKQELTDYTLELTQGPMRDFYRANFWPNTPDILPGHLQHAPPAAFKIRAALASTLVSNWGMYSGYEFCENQPLPGREEYLDSEKYQITVRDWDAPGNLKPFIGRLNKIRREQPALHEYANIAFVPCDNDQILAYRKWTDDLSNQILVVVNLDPHHTQETMIHLPLAQMNLEHDAAFTVEDLMFEESYDWRGSDNFVSLDPRSKPVHLFRLNR